MIIIAYNNPRLLFRIMRIDRALTSRSGRKAWTNNNKYYH